MRGENFICKWRSLFLAFLVFVDFLPSRIFCVCFVLAKANGILAAADDEDKKGQKPGNSINEIL